MTLPGILGSRLGVKLKLALVISWGNFVKFQIQNYKFINYRYLSLKSDWPWNKLVICTWKNRRLTFLFDYKMHFFIIFKLEAIFNRIAPIHPSKGIHWCSRKRLFEFLEASVHWCFEKITTPKIPAYFPANNPGWSPFHLYSQVFLEPFRKAV